MAAVPFTVAKGAQKVQKSHGRQYGRGPARDAQEQRRQSGRQQAPQNLALHAQATEGEDGAQADERDPDVALREIAERHQGHGRGSDHAALVQSDESDEQADASADGALQAHGDGVHH